MKLKPRTLALTPYTNETTPTLIGEYEASAGMVPGLFRWWNGKHWSQPYTPATPEDRKRRLRRQPGGIKNYDIYWRGLAKEPTGFTPHKPLKAIRPLE